MRFIYNILFTFFFCLSAPFYFLKMWRRGNWQRSFGQRFGRYSTKVKQAITNRHMIWFHAVSVGEVNLCTQLIQALEPRAPNLKIVVSTTTTTGMGELQRKLPSHIEKLYYPIDRRKYTDRALSTIHPEAVVLVEAEVWPNFLWTARNKNIPVFLVNARLSDKSYRGYKRCGFLFRKIFASFAGVGCQDEKDAERLRKLGCRPEAIRVVGNLKYDAARLDERAMTDVPQLLRRLGVPDDALLLVGGSTHPGEGGMLADCFVKLKGRFPNLFLVVVPRHFERARDVGRELEARALRFVYRSQITASQRYEPGELDCLLVNTTGELKLFYERAQVVFIGKTLGAEGGQNPLEPAALGKTMVFGPHMQNFAAIARTLVERQAAVQVPDVAALESALGELLADPARRQELGRNALQVVRENVGAVDRTVEMILAHLKDTDIYMAPPRRL